MNRNILFSLVFILYTLSLSGEKDVVTWTRVLKSPDVESFIGVARANPDAFILTGKLKVGDHQAGDGLLLKLGSDGIMEWKKRVDPTFINKAFQTKDTGFAGIVRNAGLVKISPSGRLESYRVFSGLAASGVKDVTALSETTDGGFVVGSFPGNITRLDQTGNVMWNKLYLRPVCPALYDVTPLAIETARDGGFAFTGNVTTCSGRRTDIFLTKLDSLGNVQWSRTYSTGRDQFLFPSPSISQTKDRGYLVFLDNIVLKVDSGGNVDWSGVFQNTVGRAVQQTGDGGYAILDLNGRLARLDAAGNFRWQKSYQFQNEIISLSSFVQANDGGFVLLGNTLPLKERELLAFKVDGNGRINSSCIEVIRDFDLSFLPINLTQRTLNIGVQSTSVTSRTASTSISNFVAKIGRCDQ